MYSYPRYFLKEIQDLPDENEAAAKSEKRSYPRNVINTSTDTPNGITNDEP